MIWKQVQALASGICTAALSATFSAASAQAIDTPDPLEQANCAELRIDYFSILPDLITPKQLVISATPFDEAVLAHFAKADAEDPNSLCHYRDVNKLLPDATSNRVVFFGDSITEYWGLAAPDLFKGDVLNRGVSSQNTTQMLARFHHDVIDLKPRIVHILAGVNDPMSSSGTITTRSNIIAMVELAQAHGITVVLGSLTPSTGFWLAPGVKLAPEIAALNAWLDSYAAQEGITYIDYFSPLVGAEGNIRADFSNEGLHPNRNGYDVMTSLARAELKIFKIR